MDIISVIDFLYPKVKALFLVSVPAKVNGSSVMSTFDKFNQTLFLLDFLVNSIQP